MNALLSNKYIFPLALYLAVLSYKSQGQEFFCTVNINVSQQQGDKQVFDNLREVLSQYLNNNKWTTDRYEYFERIRWSINLVVSSRPSLDYFVCRANIRVYRPVYGSNEETILLDISDNDFNFNFVAQQPLQRVENVYQDNLTALLNYYTYIVLALDYASFSEEGGAAYINKAQELVSLASSSNEKGWKAGDGDRNRYWLVENLTNSRYKTFYEAMYKYHREGVDKFSGDLAAGRNGVLEALRIMVELRRQNALLYLVNIFTQAKEQELKLVFKSAMPQQKQEFAQLMSELDPAKANEYSEVVKE